MKAMILAAGRGERMMPLTRDLPKPLLNVGGRPLIDYHMENLANAGVTDVIINVSYQGQKIKSWLGDGEKYQMHIKYSEEDQALETAGGIIKVLGHLGEEPFLVISADTWTDFSFANLKPELPQGSLANLFMVKNPAHNERGDFTFQEGDSGMLGLAEAPAKEALTYSGIGLYHPDFFKGYDVKKIALRELMENEIGEKRLYGQLLPAQWVDVGTPERLQELDALLLARYK